MGVGSEQTPDGSMQGMADLVVGLDGSAASAAALRWSVDQIGSGNRVHAVCVATSHEVPVDDLWIAEAVAGASAAQIDTVVREGSVADELLALADEVGADAIVVGHHAHARHGPRVVGRVTAKLLHHAKRPVVVVPGDWDLADAGDRPVAVGIGVSRGTEAALRWTLRRPHLVSHGLMLVHAYGLRSMFRPEGWLDVLAYHLDPSVLPTWIEQELLELAEQMQAEAGTAAEVSVEVSVAVRPRRIGARLAEAGASAGLLVIGRGEPAFVGSTIASYLRQAIIHAPCPVVVVPGPDE